MKTGNEVQVSKHIHSGLFMSETAAHKKIKQIKLIESLSF